jgi:hypothetical protein
VAIASAISFPRLTFSVGYTYRWYSQLIRFGGV